MDYQKLKLKRYQPKCMRSDKPMISISKIGFRFNVASERHMNRHYKYCELYYDKNEKVIAIKPTNELSTSSLKICWATKTNPFICARNFIKETGIGRLIGLPDDAKSIRFFPAWNEKARMFFLDLKPLIK